MVCVKSVLWPTLISNVVDVSLSGGSLGCWTACNNVKRYCTVPYCDVGIIHNCCISDQTLQHRDGVSSWLALLVINSNVIYFVEQLCPLFKLWLGKIDLLLLHALVDRENNIVKEQCWGIKEYNRQKGLDICCPCLQFCYGFQFRRHSKRKRILILLEHNRKNVSFSAQHIIYM